MNRRKSLIRAVAGLGLLLAGSQAAVAAEASFAVTGKYTAQRRPRVAVYRFDDTNSTALNTKYGASVQAMLVTFLKRKSQFVVLERQAQGLDAILDEWARNKSGQTNLTLSDPTARQLLEKLDTVILGSVTLLDAGFASPGSGSSLLPGQASGPRIEIDAKLLSRADGRIIAAAQRSGRVACLRSIVERLGVALEQDYLRPYYGQLKFNLKAPENVQIFLTPILLEDALDEEKPPVERGVTVRIGDEQDIVEPWSTDPTTYTVENLLSGWYSLRLKRPGYTVEKLENFEWLARDVFGDVRILHRPSGRPLTQVEPTLSRFVVHVDPLTTEVVQADGLGFTFRKHLGSAVPMVQRAYMDRDFVTRPERVTLIGDLDLELNSFDRPKEYDSDESCGLFNEKAPAQADYGRLYVAAGESFDPETFKGGRLVIEDYDGGTLPAGVFTMKLWEPNYQQADFDLVIRDGDADKATRHALARVTAPIKFATTGRNQPYALKLSGREIRRERLLPLDFESNKLDGFPVDFYTAATTVPHLGGWKRTLDLLPKNQQPPAYGPLQDEEARKSDEARRAARKGEPYVAETTTPDDVAQEVIDEVWKAIGDARSRFGESAPKEAQQAVPELYVKTRLVIGGRLELLGAIDPVHEDAYVDAMIPWLLDRLHATERESSGEEEQEKGAGGFWTSLRDTLVSSAPPLPPSPTGDGKPVPDGAQAPAVEVDEDAEARERRAKSERWRLAVLAQLPERLANLDLLLLSDEDMSLLRRVPAATELIARFVADGGALFAFISADGDYGELLGARLEVGKKGKRSARFKLVDGEVEGFSTPQMKKKGVRLKIRRPLPQIKDLDSDLAWRVLAFTRGHREPRIVERGKRDTGGYVVTWAEHPSIFDRQRGVLAPEVEATRSALRRHVLEWARHQMRRRFDAAATCIEPAAFTAAGG